jgi:hypothetical protein
MIDLLANIRSRIDALELRVDGYAKEALVELKKIENEIVSKLGMAHVGPAATTEQQPALPLPTSETAAVAPGASGGAVAGSVHE